MNKSIRILIIVAVVGAAVAAFVAKESKKAGAAAPVETNASSTTVTAPAKLPRLVDLGADKCIPCKKMAPILEELRTNYAGRLEVVFVDVWKKPEEAKPYNINLIPTQIFYDAEGAELFRHEGFFSREDILAKWKQLGVNLDASK